MYIELVDIGHRLDSLAYIEEVDLSLSLSTKIDAVSNFYKSKICKASSLQQHTSLLLLHLKIP